MKKQILNILFIAAGLTSFAQVGVGTDTPTTTLHVDAPAGLTTATGVTIPVVTDDMTSTGVSGTEVSQMVYSSHANSTGYYFWDGSAWSTLISSEPNLGAAIDIDVSSDVTISQNASAYNLINGAPFTDPTITLPDPSGVNMGRLIAIINTNSTTTINLGGSIAGNNTQFGGGKSGMLYSNGTNWVVVVED